MNQRPLLSSGGRVIGSSPGATLDEKVSLDLKQASSDVLNNEPDEGARLPLPSTLLPSSLGSSYQTLPSGRVMAYQDFLDRGTNSPRNRDPNRPEPSVGGIIQVSKLDLDLPADTPSNLGAVELAQRKDHLTHQEQASKKAQQTIQRSQEQGPLRPFTKTAQPSQMTLRPSTTRQRPREDGQSAQPPQGQSQARKRPFERTRKSSRLEFSLSKARYGVYSFETLEDPGLEADGTASFAVNWLPTRVTLRDLDGLKGMEVAHDVFVASYGQEEWEVQTNLLRAAKRKALVTKYKAVAAKHEAKRRRTISK
ncbi:hypothetical protein BJ170DRAFT_606343 [Xylariales sp. AK1849]|nr:hypothetical protein BJ170DRAFT_606343 [Xylariales sp. AK1849]